MKVLHIACGVSYSKVYHKLFWSLKRKQLDFEVYIPQHQNSNVKDIKQADFPFNYYANKVIRSYDKVLYFTKIKRMVKDCDKNFNLDKISIIHAHSLFSDGAVAYEINKKYGTPYIVAVRNTDVNKYFRYAPHLRKYAINILQNAKKIIFISPAYKNTVEEKFIPIKIRNEFLSKTEFIPNGVDDYWLNQNVVSKKVNTNQLNIIFVGRVDKNKNLKTVIDTVMEFNQNQNYCRLDIIGNGPLLNTFLRQYSNFEYINFHGAINEKKKIKDLYQQSDILLVPSLAETFGLVYVEAMSCGVPVIYTQNQGFDGQFNEGEVGFHVNPLDTKDIINKINKIIENYDEISLNCINGSKRFDWGRIADRYLVIYEELMNL